MSRHRWGALNKQQVGAFAEYFVKMELTMYGFEVFTTEVDDRGVDFVARRRGSPFIEVQVKSLRANGYVYTEKTKFELKEHMYLALALLFEEQAPQLYMIPAQTWQRPSNVFVDRNYDEPGQTSKPEWGVNVSKRNMPKLEEFLFSSFVQSLAREV